MQVGAELFGEPRIDGDREVRRRCCCRRSRASALRGLHLDLGHVGVYRALANGAGIAGNGEDTELFAALAREGRARRSRELTSKLPAAWRDALAALPALYGPAQEVLAAARATLPDTPAIANALAALAALATTSARRSVEALHIDLADLRGYHYQNGAIFSVFTAGRAERDRQRRPLRRHRQGVRARAPGNRLHAGSAAARDVLARSRLNGPHDVDRRIVAAPCRSALSA